ncbi:MAG: Gfo/Idh/MocA family oxidoreductase [Thermoguttaceae bacterium]|jgi:predicted dehydrogenase|nr:Gfo/Idh/MocA family oxidoreductase [Thermoguttaceae bacterium]
MDGNTLTRRNWLKAATGGASIVILGSSRSVWSYQANEKLNLAIIGAGGRGRSNLGSVSGENIVAMCDVNEQKAAQSFEQFPQAKKYHDYRKLFDELDREIDAAVVSTTNHSHAPATVMAMRRGKHVYCEKPGAHSVFEARVVTEVAAEQKVVTQRGTQMHATDNYRRIVELIRAGAIGDVRECHIWLRSGRGGLGDRPTETPPVPDWLHWDLWLGPAPYRPYHPIYANGHLWWDFGGGELGNMGCHYLDLPYWALNLGCPLTIEAEGPPPHPESTPARLHVRYQFAARGQMPPVTLTWTHGSQPSPFFAEHAFPNWAWGVFVGSRGMLLANYNQRMLWPEEQFADYQPPEPSIPPSIGHHAEWIAACKTGGATSCHFGYSGPITETMLLGNVAYRSGAKLQWDAANLKVTNASQANDLLRREYREGWTL